MGLSLLKTRRVLGKLGKNWSPYLGAWTHDWGDRGGGGSVSVRDLILVTHSTRDGACLWDAPAGPHQRLQTWGFRGVPLWSWRRELLRTPWEPAQSWGVWHPGIVVLTMASCSRENKYNAGDHHGPRIRLPYDFLETPKPRNYYCMNPRGEKELNNLIVCFPPQPCRLWIPNWLSLRGSMAWFNTQCWVPTPPNSDLTSTVTLGKWLNLSEPWCLLRSETPSEGCGWCGLSKFIFEKLWEHCLTHCKPYVSV